jgi:hypothetical protein
VGGGGFSSVYKIVVHPAHRDWFAPGRGEVSVDVVIEISTRTTLTPHTFSCLILYERKSKPLGYPRYRM